MHAAHLVRPIAEHAAGRLVEGFDGALVVDADDRIERRFDDCLGEGSARFRRPRPGGDR